MCLFVRGSAFRQVQVGSKEFLPKNGSKQGGQTSAETLSFTAVSKLGAVESQRRLLLLESESET